MSTTTTTGSPAGQAGLGIGTATGAGAGPGTSTSTSTSTSTGTGTGTGTGTSTSIRTGTGTGLAPGTAHRPADSRALFRHGGGMPPRLRIAVDAIRHGRAVVLQDDDDRENEGDLIVAAERLTVPMMATLIRECSGIVCLCLGDEALQRLHLPPMVAHNGSRHGTAFTVSIEARDGVSTGVSAADRVTTIRAAIAADATPADLVSPGHVFPLRAAPGGVLERRGHTEGAIELALLAGLRPAAVLCELMNADGSMMRGEQLTAFSRAHGYPMLTIDELAAYRLAQQPAMAVPA